MKTGAQHKHSPEDDAVGKWMRGENRPSKAVEEVLRGMGWAPEVVLGTEATPCP